MAAAPQAQPVSIPMASVKKAKIYIDRAIDGGSIWDIYLVSCYFRLLILTINPKNAAWPKTLRATASEFPAWRPKAKRKQDVQD